jgi:hypothetical protein
VEKYLFFLNKKELGHSLGSDHDEKEWQRDADTAAECLPTAGAGGGHFMMNGVPNSGYDANNYLFSPCSIRAIQRTL